MQGEQPGECEESAKVARAVGAAFGVRARAEGRLPVGNVNRVYKVRAAGRAYAVKIFRHADWPEAGKLPWVESRLKLHNVPHAELIYHTREGQHFPHGFSVSEFVEGDNCKAAMREGRLTPAAYSEMAGALLRRVHEVSVPLYGYIGDGVGMDEDFVGWTLACEVGDSLREIKDGSEPAETLYPLIERKAEPVLRRYESRFKPVLVHADCTPKNAILRAGARDGEAPLVLVDWDEAIAGFWVRDYARLTYWYSHDYKDGALAANADEIRDAFLRGYGETDFDRAELAEIESTLHLTQTAGVLSYFYRVGDAEGFARTRELLLHMLDAPR
jgi:aminoglycoside phosphotransferase (APT) family kinase protein